MASTSTASRHFGYIIKEHTVEVPWDPFTEAANAATFELFAREIYAPGNEDAPAIVYLPVSYTHLTLPTTPYV